MTLTVIDGVVVENTTGLSDEEALNQQLLREKIAHIEQLAKEEIYSIYPIEKQMNALARAAELIDIKAGRVLTADELLEETAIKAMRSEIQAIRTWSDTVEVTITVDPSLDVITEWGKPRP